MQTEFPALERPLFFDGQRLTAADLAAVQAFDRELRWLHNRALHGWGVVQGFAAGGDRRSRAVTVAPGYALDCLGRELVLARDLELAVPPVAAATTWYVTVSYAEDDALAPSETRAGVCGAAGAVRLPDEPVVRFQETSASGEAARRPGLDVVLAIASVSGCRLDAPLSTAAREGVRGEQPYVTAGRTPPGATRWRQWPDASSPLGVATTVETTVAGFRSAPRYQAHVVGERDDAGTLVVDGYPHVENAAAGSFDLCVTLPRGYTEGAGGWTELNPDGVFDPAYLVDLEQRLGWHVVWMGVEA
jgi:hypothetical protein